jgi:hypothetical protein
MGLAEQQWVPVARVSVDKSGRFYLPRETVRQLFGEAGVRECQVFVGPNKTVCLQVIERKGKAANA